MPEQEFDGRIPPTHAVVPIRWLHDLMRVVALVESDSWDQLNKRPRPESPATEKLPLGLTTLIPGVPPGYEPRGTAAEKDEIETDAG